MNWISFIFWLLGWAIHRWKKAVGWVGANNASLADWRKKYGMFFLGDLAFQAMLAFGWSVGFFRSLLTEAIPPKWVEVPESTGWAVEGALALLGGYFLGSLISEWQKRGENKKAAASNGDSA